MGTTDDPNRRQYSSDSFDRFGDDLSELLLSYLCFEDKFRFECMSKQWQRVIFNNVLQLDLRNFIIIKSNEDLDSDEDNDRDSNDSSADPIAVTEHQMKVILKKCHNVKTMTLNVNESTVPLLSLLSDHRIKSIKLFLSKDVSTEVMTAFGQTIGSKVEAIDISREVSNDILPQLNWFPNLKQLKIGLQNWQNLVGNGLVPSFTCLGEVDVESNQMSASNQLVDKYEKTMKKFVVLLERPQNKDIDFYFKQLYRLNSLESLDLSIHLRINTGLNLTDNLVNLGQYCPKLSKIRLSHWKLFFDPPSGPMSAINSWNINCRIVSDNFFAILPDLTPNLKALLFKADHLFTNEDLNNLSRIKHLKILQLDSYRELSDHSIDESAVIQLLDSCMELKDLRILFRIKITSMTISKLKELANNRPKHKMNFTILSGNRFGNSLRGVPNNLSINLINPVRYGW